jgi:glucose/mannose-6-phosphate isomerase
VSDLTPAAAAAHERLDDLAAVAAGDPHRARAALAGFPAQCRDAAALAPPAGAARRPRLVVAAAMGGSASSADLVAACAAGRLDVPVLVHRGYGLPPGVAPDTLLLAVSYSGETAEVLSAVETALARRVPVVAVSAGGALGRLAAARGVPHLAVPGGLMPRMALGYLFFPALGVLAASGLPVAGPDEIAEAVAVARELADECDPARPVAANRAKQLALAMHGRWPAIYGGPTTGGVAYRWKTDLAENAKTFALSGALPEMNHNEIEAWRAPAAGHLHLVLLRDGEEPAEVARRFTLLRELVGAAAGGISEVWARGEGRVARLLWLAYLGQWTSYYLAILARTDPWSVPLLDELKRRLRERVPEGAVLETNSNRVLD